MSMPIRGCKRDNKESIFENKLFSYMGLLIFWTVVVRGCFVILAYVGCEELLGFEDSITKGVSLESACWLVGVVRRVLFCRVRSPGPC